METKTSDWFYDNQLNRHLENLLNIQGQKVFLALANFDGLKNESKIFKEIQNKYKNSKDLIIKNIEFEDFLSALKELNVKSEMLISMIAEYELFLNDSDLLPTWKYRLDVVNCAVSENDIKKHSVYICPEAKGAYKHVRSKYFGIYGSKKVDTIAEIKGVCEVDENQNISASWFNNDICSEAELINIVKTKTEAFPDFRPIQVFVLDNFKDGINFEKDSPGGMFGSKKYFNFDGQIKTIDDLHARHYSDMYFAKFNDSEIKQIFKNIRELQMDVVYPFLLRVYADYDNNTITRDEFIQISKYCENYVLRRAICGIPTNSMNNTFSIMASKIDKEDYLISLKAYFCLLDTYKAFPKDTIFVEEFINKDIYNMRIRNYILRKLESYDNKTIVNIDNLTIEHVIPQNPSLPIHWKDELGEDWQNLQEKYLHTIGNLTLTAYNSEMSDRSFTEKLNMSGGFKESSLRLNRYIIKQTNWTEKEVNERADELSKLACKIWEYPKMTEDEIEKFISKNAYAEDTYTLDSYEHLEGYNLEMFNNLNKRILNLSSGITLECKKVYIAYKLDTNFVDVIPQKSNLKLTVNLKYSDVIDPKDICRDVTNVGKWGNGDVEISINNNSEIDDAMDIIMQAYNKQVELI